MNANKERNKENKEAAIHINLHPYPIDIFTEKHSLQLL